MSGDFEVFPLHDHWVGVHTSCPPGSPCRRATAPVHVVIPAAGAGTRFRAAGYREPKPLVDVLGKPMLQRVIENLAPALAGREYRVTVLSTVELPGIDADVKVIGPTRGAVETILAAGLDDGPLLVANCDQLVVSDWVPPLARDGWLLTFRSAKPHHSYVTVQDGRITRIAEKEVISHRAVAGVYAFEDGALFRAAAEQVLAEDRRVLGEFYVSTVIAELVARGVQLGTIDCRCAVLGTPEELDLFLAAAEVARTVTG